MSRTSTLMVLLLGLCACAVYDDSLLEPGGKGGSGGTGAEGGNGGLGGQTFTCNRADECPGEDTECQLRSCVEGICGVSNTADGTPLMTQPVGDCVVLQCDGAGDVKGVPENDPFNDGNECTSDVCAGDVPQNNPVAASTPCSAGVCNAQALCVECVDNAQCAPNICEQEVCIPATCADNAQNGNETDVDCGGSCNPCTTGEMCAGPGDCIGGVCTGGVCAATCTDGLLNNGETDLDCGGPNCGPCDIGQGCVSAGDCVAGTCQGLTCVCSGTHLMISEVRTRGLLGGNDEFVELYNPTASPVVLDASWQLEARSSSAGSYGVRWTGTGDTIPARGHYLVVRAVASGGYDESPAGDAALTAGNTDAGALRLVQSGSTVDAMCFYYSASTLTDVQAAGYECEGMPVDNSPHANSTAGMSNSNISLERAPGGALGNCVDTGDSAADFVSITPALPQSRLSPSTP